MKKNIVTVLLVFLVPICAYWILSQNSSETSAKVSSEGRPQVIKFTSTMCRDCQEMTRVFKEIFPKYQGRIDLVEVPVQDKSSFNSNQIKKYKVTLVPTIVLVDSNGNQVDRIEGAIPQDEMDRKLENLK